MFDQDIEYISSTLGKNEYLAQVFSGDTIAEACAHLRINPGALAFVRRKDEKFNSDLEYAEAFRCEMLAESLINLHDDFEDAHMMRGISENRRWLIERRNSRYRNKTEVTVSHVDLRAAMSEAAKRSAIDYNGAITLIPNDNGTDNISVEQLEHVEEDVDPLS